MNNRIIKFRFWDKDNKEWLLSSEIEFQDGEPFDLYEKNVIYLQFTGLKDKNNKDIYEGDIINISHTNEKYGGRDGNFLIEFDKGSFWAGGLNALNMYIFRGQIFEILGNIFENPELLNSK